MIVNDVNENTKALEKKEELNLYVCYRNRQDYVSCILDWR